MHSYPGGVYSYPHSIAGQLKQALQRDFPGRRFQVVTMAAFEWRLHQSLGAHLASISAYSPDIVISLDGMNDQSTFVLGEPYESGHFRAAVSSDSAHYVFALQPLLNRRGGNNPSRRLKRGSTS